jgi:hypothetical protein
MARKVPAATVVEPEAGAKQPVNVKGAEGLALL